MAMTFMGILARSKFDCSLIPSSLAFAIIHKLLILSMLPEVQDETP